MKKRNLFMAGMIVTAGLMFSCKKEKSTTTGWNYNDSKWGGFEKHDYKEQETGPNLVFIPGGTFTMGVFEQDVTGDALERRIATSLGPALNAGADIAVAHDDDQSYRWRRAPVVEGIELHIRDDLPAAREEAVIAMREAVRAALGRADIR